jgi:hypothetical protein
MGTSHSIIVGKYALIGKATQLCTFYNTPTEHAKCILSHGFEKKGEKATHNTSRKREKYHELNIINGLKDNR